ncbi:hypothetical protein P5673_023016 [Acropora cervicornis]|uniref:Secreted protein n=1 Tax=Acropora cervicornis TaxID=6130 RepID=A0AAD9UZD9_ACRCE|nr:hypothetical protein P5673_023016 [Acropora cervicornis]
MMISILVLVVFGNLSLPPETLHSDVFMVQHMLGEESLIRGSAHSIVERVTLGRKRKRVIQDCLTCHFTLHLVL